MKLLRDVIRVKLEQYYNCDRLGRFNYWDLIVAIQIAGKFLGKDIEQSDKILIKKLHKEYWRNYFNQNNQIITTLQKIIEKYQYFIIDFMKVSVTDEKERSMLYNEYPFDMLGEADESTQQI